MLLAGDLGGTKTNLAVYTVEGGPRHPVAESKFDSDEYPSLAAMVREFLLREKIEVDDIDYARFGVAGPVVGGRAKITNLPWILEEDDLEAALELKSVRLMNDLEAIANGIPFVEADDLHTLREGEVAANGTIAVVAPGTGLGEAYLTWDGTRYRAHPSEGGHVDFAPTNALETEMLHFLRERFGRVSYERVCSGSGLPNIYDFLKASGRYSEPDWLAAELADAEDRTPIIARAGMDADKACELCRATLDMFVTILGAEAGNMGLKVMATGGVFLAGGIPPRLLPLLKSDAFLSAFDNKGRLSTVLEKMPVRVVLNPKVPLLGAACDGLIMIGEEG